MKLIPKKALGQNFLVDKKVIDTLVETTEITKDDIVLEIGAGTGNVTKELARKAEKVIAVEFDRDLIPVLKTNLAKFNNVTIINQDILKLKFSALGFGPPAGGMDLGLSKVVGSIPYQITSPLIHKLLIEVAPQQNQQVAGKPCPKKKMPQPVRKDRGIPQVKKEPPSSTIGILIQKEVAEKITAQTPEANYLSNFVQGLAKASYIQTVSHTAFKPQPKVDGAILKMEPHYRVLFKHNIKPQNWSNFLHKAFLHPRKMLRNVFAEQQLKEANIDPRSRPQELSVMDWTTLYKIAK